MQQEKQTQFIRKTPKMSTYFVYDQHDEKDEIRRLSIEDPMVTAAMGGVLAEQADPSVFHHVLDIGCGTGGWAIAAARQYPEMRLTGIDINLKMIDYAIRQAMANKVSDRVEFMVMDALRPLAFPDDCFDLVNLRFGVSFIRKWEWSPVICEMLRVTRPGGVVRITDTEIVQHSNSTALKIFQKMLLCALNRAWLLFEEDTLGITAQLAPLLKRNGAQAVQTQTYATTYEADQLYIENATYAMKTLKPFIKKWGCAGQTYEEVCQMAREQINQADFYAIWQLLTAWGQK